MSWTGGGTSTGIVTADGYVEFTNSQTTTLRAIGLVSSPLVTFDWQNLLFGIYVDSTNVWHTESGVGPGTIVETTCAISDTFRIAVSTTREVTYLKNGVVFYTSLIEALPPFYVGACLNTSGAEFEFVTISNVQDSALGVDPQVMLSLSNDGGKTFGPEMWRSMGKRGEYLTRVRWNRLGAARRRVFEVAVTDPVPWKLTGAYLESFSTEKP